jgi:hypothetical protein
MTTMTTDRTPGGPAEILAAIKAGATALGNGWTTDRTHTTWTGEPYEAPGRHGRIADVVRIGIRHDPRGAPSLTFETGHIDPGPYDIAEDDETTQAEALELEMENLPCVVVPFPAARKMIDLIFVAMTLHRAAGEPAP